MLFNIIQALFLNNLLIFRNYPYKEVAVLAEGRLKKDATNLLNRLENYREDILRFLGDSTSPSTNNQGEQDIRSFVSSARKRQCPVFRSLLSRSFIPE